jgi:hypothetical protein
MNLGQFDGKEPAGAHFRNYGSMAGVSNARRNPKRKSRLPYHARKQTSLVVVTDPNARHCPHALSAHEVGIKKANLQSVTISYAHGCISKHSSKTVQHRDVTGRKW